MKTLKIYHVILKSGVGRKLSRYENSDHGENLVGLWVWACKRVEDVFIDFEETTLLAKEIAMIDSPIDVGAYESQIPVGIGDFWSDMLDSHGKDIRRLKSGIEDAIYAIANENVEDPKVLDAIHMGLVELLKGGKFKGGNKNEVL